MVQRQPYCQSPRQHMRLRKLEPVLTAQSLGSSAGLGSVSSKELPWCSLFPGNSASWSVTQVAGLVREYSRQICWATCVS